MTRHELRTPRLALRAWRATDLDAYAALHFAFSSAGLDEVVSFTVPANIASQAVMQRIGMRYDGVFDHPRAEPTDWWRPHVLYRVSAADLVDARSALTEPSGRTPP